MNKNLNNKLIKLSLKQLLNAESYIGENYKHRDHNNLQDILAIRNNTDIINLQKTLTDIEPVLHIITNTIANYEQILIVAQHPSASTKEFKEFPQPLLTKKWVHGALSNFKTIKQSKKNSFFSNLKRIPNALVLLHTNNSSIILNETKYLEIPTIAFQDTSSNPLPYFYKITCNNQSDASIRLYLKLIAKASFYGYAKRLIDFKYNTNK